MPPKGGKEATAGKSATTKKAATARKAATAGKEATVEKKTLVATSKQNPKRPPIWALTNTSTFALVPYDEKTMSLKRELCSSIIETYNNCSIDKGAKHEGQSQPRYGEYSHNATGELFIFLGITIKQLRNGIQRSGIQSRVLDCMSNA